VFRPSALVDIIDLVDIEQVAVLGIIGIGIELVVFVAREVLLAACCNRMARSARLSRFSLSRATVCCTRSVFILSPYKCCVIEPVRRRRRFIGKRCEPVSYVRLPDVAVFIHRHVLAGVPNDDVLAAIMLQNRARRALVALPRLQLGQRVFDHAARQFESATHFGHRRPRHTYAVSP
jgi:hypothetical protein